jgi:hypothetical protein
MLELAKWSLLLCAMSAGAAGGSASPLGGSNGVATVLGSDGQDYVFGLIDGGLFKMTAASLNWVNISAPIAGNRVQSYTFTDEKNIYVGTDNAGVWSSSDGGLTWTAHNTGLTCLLVHGYTVVSALEHVIAAHCSDRDAIFQSLDGGNSWTQSGDFGAGSHINRLAPSVSSTSRSFAYTTVGAFVQETPGAQWMAVSDSPTIGSYYGAIPKNVNVWQALAIDKSSTVREENMTVEGVGVFHTDNSKASGAKMQLANGGLPAFTFGRRINAIAGTAYVPVVGHGLYTYASGAWSLAISEQALPGVDRIIALASLPNTWLAASRTSGVWRSDDSGHSWQRFGVVSTALDLPTQLSLPAGTAPASAVSMSSVGAQSGVTLTAELIVSELLAASGNQPLRVYVVAAAPASLFGQSSGYYYFQKGPDGSWSQIGTSLTPYIQGIEIGSLDGRLRVELGNSVDLSAMHGLELYLAYGTSDTDMLSARRYIGVYRVP